MHEIKSFLELKKFLKFEIDLFNPFFQNVFQAEFSLVKCKQVPKNKRDSFNDIIEKYLTNIKDKCPKELTEKNLSHQVSFFKPESLENTDAENKPSAPPAMNPHFIAWA